MAVPSRTVDPAGTLRHRIALQQPQTENNDYGEPVTVWATIATVWAAVRPLEGRELWNAKQVQPDVTHQIAVRDGSHLEGINPAWRAVFGSRVFEIESVTLRDERALTMRDLLCREQV